MRFCVHCGKELPQDAVFCIGCGCPVPPDPKKADPPKRFCTKCGAEVGADAVVCLSCGCAVHQVPSPANPALLNDLSSRVRTNGVIWICIACLQILIGIAGTFVPLIFGVMNLVSGIGDLNYAKEMQTKPVGLVKRFEPLGWPIAVLVFNLLFGGVIGVVGSIYYLVAVRGFVMQNQESFLAMENGYAA